MEVCREWNRKVTNYRQKTLSNIGIFTAIYFVIFFAGIDAGVYPYLYPTVRIGMPHPVRYSLYAVLNKGQEVWHGILDRYYSWLTEFNHG